MASFRLGIPQAVLAACLLGLLDRPPGAGADADYYPLARGSQWTYSVLIMGGALGFQEGRSVTTVEREEKVNGRVYFRVSTTFAGIGIPGDSYLIRKGPEGVFKLEAGGEQLMMPLPLTAGLKWSTRGERGDVVRHVAEGPQPVDLASDTYANCFKVVHTSIVAESADYFAPNVGLVRTEGRMAGATLQFSLDSYRR